MWGRQSRLYCACDECVIALSGEVEPLFNLVACFFDVFLRGDRRGQGGKRRRAEFCKGREEVWRRKK